MMKQVFLLCAQPATVISSHGYWEMQNKVSEVTDIAKGRINNDPLSLPDDSPAEAGDFYLMTRPV